eukprot:GEMP01031315.1.p1 GENE.GEMP01031315.1~~GEMP01031315.1.p1  ORF type:complete len:491 (+),score=110.25 GEMP01031315.1:343-1815(+)
MTLEERQDTIRSNLGNFAFWDIYLSGWPLFALLDLVGILARNSGLEAMKIVEPPANTPFYAQLWKATPSMALQQLAESDDAFAHCDSSKASAYFTVVRSLLVREGSIPQQGSYVRNATYQLFSLGEEHVHCQREAHIIEHAQSIWRYFGVLGFLERTTKHYKRSLAQVGTAVPPTGRHSPKPAPSDIAKKYPIITSSERPGKPHGCPGDVHVAIAADKLQVDGVIVTLNSMIKRARRPARLCLHVFLLPDEVDFVTAALQCAFDKLQFEAAENSAYIVNGAWVTLRGEVDFAMAPKPPDLTSSGQNKTGAFAKDTGNLRVPHNFIRFYLYKLIHADKVIYLDVDIVVQGDITELWDDAELEESGATICAVVRQTSISIYVPGIVRPDSPVWMPLAAETFNAGVMVMDLKRWRERNIHERYEEWLRIRDVSREPLWVHGSQPLLLVMFYDEVSRDEMGVCVKGGVAEVMGVIEREERREAKRSRSERRILK